MAELKVFPGYGQGEAERKVQETAAEVAAVEKASGATLASQQLEAAREAEAAARAATEAAKEAQRQLWVKAFRPRGDYVFLEIVIREATAGGIVLPDERKELPGHGTVLAVGPTVSGSYEVGNESHTFVPNIKVGDHVWFSRYCGASIEYPDGSQDARYRIVAEGEIFGHFTGLEGQADGQGQVVPVPGTGDAPSGAGDVAT